MIGGLITFESGFNLGISGGSFWQNYVANILSKSEMNYIWFNNVAINETIYVFTQRKLICQHKKRHFIFEWVKKTRTRFSTLQL